VTVSEPRSEPFIGGPYACGQTTTNAGCAFEVLAQAITVIIGKRIALLEGYVVSLPLHSL